MIKLGAALVAAVIGCCARGGSAMEIIITPDDTLAGNSAAMAAFNRAAQDWGGIFSNNITVNISAGMGTSFSSPNVIGHTSSVLFQSPYDFFRDKIAASAALEPDDGIVAYLPDLAHFTATLPAGFTFSGKFIATKANFKVLAVHVLRWETAPENSRWCFPLQSSQKTFERLRACRKSMAFRASPSDRF
jgi:hypothetical protein